MKNEEVRNVLLPFAVVITVLGAFLLVIRRYIR